jgi:hypothetical protein
VSPHGRKPISISSVPQFEQRCENELRANAFIQVKKEKLKIVPLP